jgi:hypothetical protein
MAFRVIVPTVEEQFERILNLRWVGPCPPDEPGAPCINDWVYTVARACAKRPFGIRAAVMDRAIDLTRAAMTRGEKGDEVRRAFQKAYGQAYDPSHKATPPVEFGDYDPDVLAEIAMEGPEVTPEQLARRSPVSVDVSAAEFFRLVFPGEKVFATTWPMTKSGFVYEGPNESEELQRYLDGNKEGAWFLSNPVDGKWRDTVDGSQTVRSEANLTNFRHIVLESDVAPADQWLAMLVQQPLAIVALYRSGGRSIHALVRINAKNKAEFDRERDRMRVKYCPLGADSAAMSAVRLTRVPNVIRGDNFAYQKLIYLNPKPIARAIWQEKTL